MLLFVCASITHLNLIVLADGHAAHVVLLTQLLGQGRGHQLSADVRRRAEVALAVLAAVRRDMLVELHLALVVLLHEGSMENKHTLGHSSRGAFTDTNMALLPSAHRM